ncbi:hypothetical protein HZA38_00435 [Candidatus Peregrinibacteria bacterium]|nr:hypothetical protein [Candidatus Peregrinibacteria bacterium]
MNKISSHSIHLFAIIPLLFGVAIQVFAFTATPLQNTISQKVSTNNSVSPNVFEARVIPTKEQRPNGNPPEGNIETEFLPAIIKIVLALMSTATLGVLIVSGVLFVVNYGDEEKLKHAKSLLVYAVVGIVLVVIAYAAVEAITKLTFTRT